MKGIELKELAGGALEEQFGKAFDRVIENLQNPNTPYRNSREINIKLKFTQNEARDDVKCGIFVTEKLAAQTPTETAFAIGTDLRNGKLYAHEYGKQVKGQISIDEIENVDMETGEVNAVPENNVVDLRKANEN